MAWMRAEIGLDLGRHGAWAHVVGSDPAGPRINRAGEGGVRIGTFDPGAFVRVDNPFAGAAATAALSDYPGMDTKQSACPESAVRCLSQRV